MSALLDIARLLATEQDLDAFLFGLLDCLSRLWPTAEAGMVLLYNPADDKLAVRAAYGYHLSPLGQIRIAPGEGTSGRTFEMGTAAEPVRAYATPAEIAEARSNLAAESLEMLRAASAGFPEPSSAVGVLLTAANAQTIDTRSANIERSADRFKVGVLILESRQEEHPFLPADLAFLREVAQLCGQRMACSSPPAQHTRSEPGRGDAPPGYEREPAEVREEATRLKAELISTLAHEMRTPLTSIKGFSTALLMEEASFSPETQREFLQIIDQECDVLEELIHDLLESSVIDAGLLKLDPQPAMLQRLIHNLVDEMARRTQKHRFVVDLPQDLPIVEADPLRIDQVLRNLLDNACKYSPQGGMIVIRGQVQEETAGSSPHGGRILISVSDQGVGIAPEHLNRLFEKFFRAESNGEHHVVGSGLGLPIARTIVESHGGHIWAESRLGEGSTFYFTLPLPEASSE